MGLAGSALAPNRRLLRSRLCALVVLLAALPARAGEPFAPFEFAFLGDPEIGCGPGGNDAGSARLARVVDDLNVRPLPVTIIAGDLAHDRTVEQERIFAAVTGRLRGRVLLTPGDRDVTDVESLQDYRERHGGDYYDAIHRNVAFVVFDSETARDQRISAREFAVQWDFIEQLLARHREAGRTHVVFVTHRPPFTGDEHEPESADNWPPETRARLLALARSHGVRWILSGHLHRTVVIDARAGLVTAVAADTGCARDGSPVGYLRFHADADRITMEQVTLAAAPTDTVSH